MEPREDWNNNYYEEQPRKPVIIVGEPDTGQHKKNSNASVTALTLGILSLVFFWIPYIALVLAVIGLINGIISIAQQRDGQKMAVAGIITSGIGAILSLIAGFVGILAMIAA